MPYQYGMQNAPAGGNGLGGLPKKQTTPARSNFTRIVTAGRGTIVPPANAKYMRVAVIGGGGGNGTGFRGAGGGGGCAASIIVPASAINYSIGEGGAVGSAGTDTTANWSGFSLVGQGGKTTTTTTGGLGGGASGGSYNYTGGRGGTYSATTSSCGGGGAAGPMGNGANGGDGESKPAAAGSINLLNGWGVGGGGGGSGETGSLSTGGAGAGAPSTSTNFSVFYAGVLFGHPPNSRNGGEMGGGGGNNSGGPGLGGVGGIVVEWFY